MGQVLSVPQRSRPPVFKFALHFERLLEVNNEVIVFGANPCNSTIDFLGVQSGRHRLIFGKSWTIPHFFPYNTLMRILIVDDSRIMRNIVKNALKNLKYPPEIFLEASDGEAAWQVLENQEVSLILLDWNMPALNGLELVKKLRATAKYQKLPIIMVTSEAAKYNVIEAVKAGVSDYLVKPLTEKGLEEKLRRVFGGANQ